MSAAFKFGGEMFWGTNAAVEAYTQALAVQAAIQLGQDHPLAVHFHEEWDGFYSGKLLILDQWLTDTVSREKFLGLLDAATDQLLQDGTFTSYGREWVAIVITCLRSKIAAG